LKARVVSKEKVVTFKVAKLDIKEQYWLGYFAEVFLGKKRI